MRDLHHNVDNNVLYMHNIGATQQVNKKVMHVAQKVHRLEVALNMQEEKAEEAQKSGLQILAEIEEQRKREEERLTTMQVCRFAGAPPAMPCRRPLPPRHAVR